MSGDSKKSKSPIVLELQRAGFRKGSKAYKRAYHKLWRSKNSLRWKEYGKRYRKSAKGKEQSKRVWQRYYRRKAQSSPGWNSQRLAKWRKKKPGRWRAIMKKASQNGLHRRWYQKNREKKLRRTYELKKERNPLYGLTKKRQRVLKGGYDINTYLGELGDALVRVKQESHSDRGKPANRKGRVRVRSRDT